MTDKYKVIQWGTGYIGYYALRYILSNPKLELVGVKCFTPEKEGKTASELCGLGSSQVRATRDAKSLIATEADCIIYMPRDPLADPTLPDSPSLVWFNELLDILASGKNVVTSLTSGTHHRHLRDGEAFRKKLNEACKQGRSTLFFTGFDPGFSDILALTMSGAVGNVKQIRTWEIVDYGDYPVLETLRSFGFSLRPQEMPKGGLDMVRANWGGVPYLMADALGLELSGIAIEADVKLAPETFVARGGLVVPKGTICALRFTVTGLVAERPMFVVNHVTRIGQAAAPDWPSIGRDGGYRVEIDSFPPFRGDFPMGMEGGTGTTLADAMCMTSARCVNSIAAVVNAQPGYRTFLELPPITSRYST